MATASVDRNVELLIEDVGVLRSAMQDAERDPERHRQVMETAAGYLVANQPLLERAFTAWRETPEEQLRALDEEHRELDSFATTHSVEEVAWQAVRWAPNVVLGAPLIDFSEDDLNVLGRVLRFAKFVADTSGEEVRWHPARQLLAEEHDARVEELRTSLRAQQQTVKQAPPPTTTPLPFSDASARALSLALGLQTDPAAAMLIGALRLPRGDYGHTVAAALAEELGDGDVAARAAAALGVEPLPPPVEGIDRATIASTPLGALAERAAAHAVPSSADRIHLRYLLAAALTPDDPEPVERMLVPFTSSLSALRTPLRAAIARVPGEPAEYWDRVLGTTRVTELAGGTSSDVVSQTEPIPLSEDDLGVANYVTMLAAVIAGTGTGMPLSIGLFGEWGSGKSYFMGLLRHQVYELAGSSDAYKRDIRQITFNAWHYADTNLWASLGDEIFAQLAPPGDTDDEKVARLRKDLDGTLQQQRQLEAATVRAEEETARLSATLDQAHADHANSLRRLATVATSSELDKAWRRLGISEPVEKGELLAREIRGGISDAQVLRRSIAGRAGVLAALVVIAGVLIVAAVLAPADATSWLAGAAVSALGVATAIVGWARSGLKLLSDAAVALREGADKATHEQLEALRRSEAKTCVTRAQLDEVVDRVGELGRQLAELDPGQRLYRFLSDKATGDTYRSQLGLISTVRKDFEQLERLMDAWRDPAIEAPDPIDRIVLYIDDLDRCSPEQVVAVLQAVHLLLAMKLFVVVVGVDPRWLLRSLQREYKTILTSDDGVGDDQWVTTPQDYLEKIFNIPFALPGMTSDGFRGLIEGLAKSGQEDAPPPSAADTTEPSSAPARVVTDVPVEAGSEVATAQAGTPAPKPEPLTEPELELLTALAPLVGTPREAKRLMNLYRMIRSTRDLSPASRFLGDWSHAGEYQAVIVLLGLLSSHGRLLEAVLTADPQEPPGARGGLLHRPPETAWATFAADLGPRPVEAGWVNDVVGPVPPDDLESWRRLAAGLTAATELVKLGDLATFQLWAPRVARFSFLATTADR